jgi:hypothetical protein
MYATFARLLASFVSVLLGRGHYLKPILLFQLERSRIERTVQLPYTPFYVVSHGSAKLANLMRELLRYLLEL